MNFFIEKIAHLFSSSPHELEGKSTEDFDGLAAYYHISHFDRELPANLDISGLNERDVLNIGLFDGVDENATEQRVFHTDTMEEWSGFAQFFSGLDKEDPIKIKISIAKRKANGKRSVYCAELFSSFLKGLGFKDVRSMFDEQMQGQTLCLEYQEGDISLVGTKLAFVSKGHQPVFLLKPILNEDVINQGKFLCCNDLICENLLPTDFELKGTDHDVFPLKPLFQKAAVLYSLCFLFDFVSLRGSKIEYKLNGYKTLKGTINVDTLEATEIDDESWLKYLEIFKWQYNGGNLIDKSAIARNIISLNIVDDKSLALREGTYDAIDSNYRIYEKENVKQYIEIRNNVATQLHDYQQQIIGIYDNFESDFKKLLFSFLTFAFTTAIIRVLAKNMEGTILIPNTIITLLLGFCAISMLYYAYARWERDKKVELFDKQYNDTRRFYAELLSDKEMKELFTDKRNEDGTYRAFIEERTCRYDWLWIGVNLIFIGILLYIRYYINVTA